MYHTELSELLFDVLGFGVRFQFEIGIVVLFRIYLGHLELRATRTTALCRLGPVVIEASQLV